MRKTRYRYPPYGFAGTIHRHKYGFFRIRRNRKTAGRKLRKISPRRYPERSENIREPISRRFRRMKKSRKNLSMHLSARRMIRVYATFISAQTGKASKNIKMRLKPCSTEQSESQTAGTSVLQDASGLDYSQVSRGGFFAFSGNSAEREG